MIIDLAALLATALLLVTLVSLEVRRAGPDPVQPPRHRLLARFLSRRAVTVMWAVYLLFFVPRVVGLLT